MRYTVKAAARATGVSESRLRTWERRYGIPHPGRSGSGRRLYSDDDLEVIRRMAAFVEAGVSAAEAAAAARADEAPLSRTTTGQESAAVKAFVEAGLRYDEFELTRLISTGAAELGWGAALDQLILPALRKIGDCWRSDELISANEHFVTEVVRREIAAAIAALPASPPETPGVLLACVQDERHDLGLLALALLLREQGLRVFYLGADVPQEDVLTAATATGAAAICLSATLASNLPSLSRAARHVVGSRTSLPLFAGGPALREDGEQPLGIRLPQAVSDAAAVISRTLIKE